MTPKPCTVKPCTFRIPFSGTQWPANHHQSLLSHRQNVVVLPNGICDAGPLLHALHQLLPLALTFVGAPALHRHHLPAQLAPLALCQTSFQTCLRTSSRSSTRSSSCSTHDVSTRRGAKQPQTRDYGDALHYARKTIRAAISAMQSCATSSTTTLRRQLNRLPSNDSPSMKAPSACLIPWSTCARSRCSQSCKHPSCSLHHHCHRP